MTSSSPVKKVRPLYMKILADQEVHKNGVAVISFGDVASYKAARLKSPEAEKEFLDRRAERKRMEAKNSPAAPPPPPVIPPPSNETTELIQEIARNGILLSLVLIRKRKPLLWKGKS